VKEMRRIIKYVLLVAVGTIALYPSVSMALIWIDVWNQGAKIVILPDLTMRFLVVFFTITGCALTFGIISYFFVRLLQEDIKRLKRRIRERKAKPPTTETKKKVAPKRQRRTRLKPEETAS
jgi:hypothetical protein